MPLPSFTTSAERRALAGVCAGIADALGVDVTLVRLVFALLALAGGAGIVLYLALWAWSRSEREWWAVLLLVVAVGLALAAVGAVVLLGTGNAPARVLAPGAVAGALLLVAGPWLWRLALERDVERAARIRTEERADVAERVHDSVLQTLALIQRHAEEPRRVASLARRQERELRGWLYGDGATAADTLVGALAAAAGDIEEL